MSQEWVRDIEDMHSKFGFKDLEFTGDFLRFRQRFLEEELREMDEGIIENDPAKVVDSLIDLCVVAIGTLQLGMGRHRTEQAWDIVHMANMAKERQDNPERYGAGGFDLIKPEGWQPPDYSNFISFGNFPAAIRQILEGIAADMSDAPPDKDDMVDGHILQDPPYILILKELVPFARGKNRDYNQIEGGHARHYPRGITDIFFLIHQKYVRIESLLKQMEEGIGPANESLEDSFRDLAIYGIIGMAWLRGKIVGQSGFSFKDIFNRKVGQNVVSD